MRKAIVGGLTAVAVVVSAVVFAPMVRGQGSPRPRPNLERRIQILEGRGSAIGISIRDLSADEALKAIIVRSRARQTLALTPEASARPFAADVVLPDIQREIERGMRAIPRNFSFDFDPDAVFPAFPQGRLGITAAPLTDQLAAYFKVKAGVLVSNVAPGSPAEKAGLRAGDVITSVNGRNVGDPHVLTEELRDAKPESDVELGVTRDGQAMILKTTVPDRVVRPARGRPA